jgi:MFS family permease
MGRRRSLRSDEMLLAFGVWACSLPLVAGLIGPWLGWRVALAVAGLLLIVALLACWGACGWQVAQRARSRNHDT